MTNVSDLAQQLIELPPKQYSELIKTVDTERRQAVERDEKEHPAHSGMSRDEFAHWIAHRHFAIDKGVSHILYLATGAPPKEVRLLEVNVLANIPENAPVEAVDFMPDVAGIDYSLFVADVSPRQFEGIQKGLIALPQGWKLEGACEIAE
jgi:hypothetical protein